MGENSAFSPILPRGSGNPRAARFCEKERESEGGEGNFAMDLLLALAREAKKMCRSRCPPPPNSLESRNRRAARGFPEPKPMRSLREMLGEAKRRKLLALFTTNTRNP